MLAFKNMLIIQKFFVHVYADVFQGSEQSKPPDKRKKTFKWIIP